MTKNNPRKGKFGKQFYAHKFKEALNGRWRLIEELNCQQSKATVIKLAHTEVVIQTETQQ